MTTPYDDTEPVYVVSANPLSNTFRLLRRLRWSVYEIVKEVSNQDTEAMFALIIECRLLNEGASDGIKDADTSHP